MFNKALYAMLSLVALLVLPPMGFPIQTAQAGTPYNLGDVFAGVGNGKVNQYDQDGTLIQVLDTGGTSFEQTGMCFDAAGHLRVTSWTAGTMTEFDADGDVVTSPWAGPWNKHPETCEALADGTIVVGEVDGSPQRITKWSADGLTLLDTNSPAVDGRGTDWLDIGTDSCTVKYTSEIDKILAYNICTDTQLPDFATGLPGGTCFALRERANGEVLVACSDMVNRLDSTGTVLQSYTLASMGIPDGFVFALNLDPDGTSFWTAEYGSGAVRKVDIGAGTVLKSWTATPNVFSTAGLAVFGELGTPPPPPTGGPVGGTVLPIDMVSLVMAGIYSQPQFVTIVGALAAALFTALRLRKKL